MNGKMRAGIMLRIAGVPNTNRQIVARLPVQNAIGSPSMSSSPSPPNRIRLSQPIDSSLPIFLASPPAQHDVLQQLRDALQHDERGPERDRELHRPVLARP